MAKNIHNVMEEEVITEIDRICESIEKEAKRGSAQYKGICTCVQCKLDAACYVLNRIAPGYVVSGRGITHAAQDTLEKQQKKTDISILVYEAILQVAHNQRPNIDHKVKKEGIAEGMFFNIPVIYGRILNGATFAPIDGIEVYLHYNETPVPMRNENFSNPCKLNDKTNGFFTFWPEGIPAPRHSACRKFNYVLYADTTEYESFSHSFVIAAESDSAGNITLAMSRRFQLPELYMFPKK
ncbi:MAG: late competence development ComFB family protein [Spirochaetaceae bacterium]|jgi:competence protein ComFB|nr:late competence development ComFB family protein [Spirochaetaceae bacterium]